MTRAHKAPRSREGNAPAPSNGRPASSALTRLGVRLGLMDPQSPETAATGAEGSGSGGRSLTGARAEAPATPAPPATAQQKGDAPPPDTAVPDDLTSLNLALVEERTAEIRPETTPSSVRVRYPVLEGKKVVVAGFSGLEQKALLDLLQTRSSVPILLTHDEAAGEPAPWRNCDLVLMNTPPEWAITEPIDPGWLAKVDKPALVFGAKEVLSRAGGMARSGARDFVAPPWSDEDVAWRSAMLLSRSLEAPPLQPARPSGPAAPEVVIAEDDTTTRALLSAMLSRHGMVCHVTDNGGTALELVRRLRPAAVILDVSMPCLDGFQVLAAIKQDPSLANIQVVLLTSRQTELDVLQGFGLGADDYMTKPFSPMELAARLKRLIVRAV
jgi:CheY-like chemotaxis protein